MATLNSFSVVFCIKNKRKIRRGERPAADERVHVVPVYDDPETAEHTYQQLIDSTTGNVEHDSERNDSNLIYNTTHYKFSRFVFPCRAKNSVQIISSRPSDPAPFQSLPDTLPTQSQPIESETPVAQVVTYVVVGRRRIGRPTPRRKASVPQPWRSLDSIEPASPGDALVSAAASTTQAQIVTPYPYAIYRPGPNEYDSYSGPYSLPPILAPTDPPAPAFGPPAAPTHA